VLKAMVTMAHELNYRVVAEGVETQEALDRVSEAGCEEAQGYFIARPLEVPALEQWLGTDAARVIPGADRLARYPLLR